LENEGKEREVKSQGLDPPIVEVEIGVGGARRRYTANERRAFGKLMHDRTHMGRGSNVVAAMKRAYGDAFEYYKDACDACMYSKARLHTRNKKHSRPAKQLGDRLHYDVFHGPSRSSEGYRYVLVVIDEFTSRSWAIGLRSKKDVFASLRDVIAEVETRMHGLRVQQLGTLSACGEPHVVEIRSDNAGENLLSSMRALLRKNGTRMETSVAYHQWQNGKAERLGGVIMKGGRAFLYGGHLPARDWFRCVAAFNHVRNRTPNANSAKHDGRTPYELWHDIRVSLPSLLAHLRIVGTLVYVMYPPVLVPSGGEVCFKGVLLGYADDGEKGQKAYVVRRLSDGKIMIATYAQTHSYEHHFPHKPNVSANDCVVVERDDEIVRDDETESDEKSDDDEKSDEKSDDEKNDDETRDCARLSASDELKDEVDEAMDLEANTRVRVGFADDVSGDSPPTMKSIVSENEHDGSGDAMLVCEDLDAADNDDAKHDAEHVYCDESDVMTGVPDMVRALEERERARPTHTHKLRQRPSADVELEGKQELAGEVRDVVNDVAEAEEASRFTRARHTPLSPAHEPMWEVSEILDVGRMGKKNCGKLKFEVQWEAGDVSWELPSALVGGANHELRAFLSHMSVLQKSAFKRGELQRLMLLIAESEEETGDESDDGIDDETDIDDLPERDPSPASEKERKKRIGEKLEIVRAIILLTRQKTALGQTVPSTLKQARKHPNWGAFATGMQAEFDSFQRKGVWRLVPRPANVNVVTVRWVFDIKTKNGVVERYKARLVCRGFAQKEGVDYNPTELYAPTMKTKSLRVLTALAARNGWDMNQYDVSCAFLHADLEETVYVEQPEGHEVVGKELFVYVLDKAMYGLKQAPRAFSKHLAACFKTLNFKMSAADECLWTLTKANGVKVYALYHVDDIIMMSDDNAARDDVFVALCTQLDLRDEGRVDVFLNMKFVYGVDGSISLSQTHYIEKMAERFGVACDEKITAPGSPDEKLEPCDLPVTVEEQKAAAKLPYPALIGSLIYACLTRPDVNYAISNVAMYMSRWGVKHYEHALRVLKYLYHTRHNVLTYRKWKGDVTVQCYVDANYGDQRDSGANDKWCSQGGYLIFVGDCLVSWSSKRHRCRTLSSMEAEYVEATRSAQEVIWMRKLLDDLGHTQTSPTIMWEDNKAAIAFSKNQTCHDRSKHIDIRAHWLRDLVLDQMISMLYVATANQLADFMTKHLRGPAHIKARDIILGGLPLPQEGHDRGMVVNFALAKQKERCFRLRTGMREMGGIECY
jgi:transposase InsO family protein